MEYNISLGNCWEPIIERSYRIDIEFGESYKEVIVVEKQWDIFNSEYHFEDPLEVGEICDALNVSEDALLDEILDVIDKNR
ncbi:MAG: hypothetical protein WA061_01780 [Microgenomates group bacterium]